MASILLMANCEPTPKATMASSEETSTSLRQKLKNDPFLVDVRTREEFAAGSVEGAVNIPLDEVESRVSEFEGKKNVVVFCRTGNRSSQAISILKSNGITNVSNGTDVETIEKYQRYK